MRSETLCAHHRKMSSAPYGVVALFACALLLLVVNAFAC